MNRQKMGYIYTMEYYPGIKKNEIMSVAGKMDRSGNHHVK
jgi:hypothetical protein